MAEFEEKLNAILGDPSAMDQILSLARSLSGESAAEPPSAEAEGESKPDLSALLGGVDPGLLRAGLQILGREREGNDKNAALLEALRPFLKEERRGRLDRAQEILRVARLVRVALDAAGKGGDRTDV